MATSRVRPVGVSAAVAVHAVAAGTMASRNGSAMLAPIPFSTVRRGRHFLAMKGMMSSSSESLLRRRFNLAARGETPAAFGAPSAAAALGTPFGRRCIAALGATLEFHHGLHVRGIAVRLPVHPERVAVD